MNKKILVIENQITHYKELKQMLGKKGFDVFPNQEEEYINFLEHVKISLNSRYGARCYRSMKWFKNRIKELNPDILVVDHILVGTHSAENGIDLINNIQDEIDKPVIFYSRTERNNAQVCKKLSDIKLPYRWIPKEFSGRSDPGDGKKEIFKSVVDSINELTGQSVVLKIKQFLKEKRPILSLYQDEYDICSATDIIINAIGQNRINCTEDLLNEIKTEHMNNYPSSYKRCLENIVKTKCT